MVSVCRGVGDVHALGFGVLNAGVSRNCGWRNSLSALLGKIKGKVQLSSLHITGGGKRSLRTTLTLSKLPLAPDVPRSVIVEGPLEDFQISLDVHLMHELISIRAHNVVPSDSRHLPRWPPRAG